MMTECPKAMLAKHPELVQVVCDIESSLCGLITRRGGKIAFGTPIRFFSNAPVYWVEYNNFMIDEPMINSCQAEARFLVF